MPAEIGIVAHLPGPATYDGRRRPVVEAGTTQVADRAINPEAATVKIILLEECQLSGGRHGRDESEAYNKYCDLHRVSLSSPKHWHAVPSPALVLYTCKGNMLYCSTT